MEVETKKLSAALLALATPVFGYPVTMPSFVIGTIPVSTSGAQLNYLNQATGTTGTTSKKIVFSESPEFSGDVKFPGSGIWNSNGRLGVNILTPSQKVSIKVDANDDGLEILNPSGNQVVNLNSFTGKGGVVNVGSGTGTYARIRGYSLDGVQGYFVSGNMGFGTYTARRKIDILDAVNPQLRLSYSDNDKYVDFQVDADGNVTITPIGPLLNLPTTVRLQSSNYVSQLTGWGITGGGSADFRYVYADEIYTKAFIADLEQALAGGQIICKSVAEIYSDFTLPTAGNSGTLVVKDLPSATGMAVFVAGDIVRLRQFSRAGGSLTIADAWGVVTGYVDNGDGTQNWTFTRSAGGLAGTAAGTISSKTLALDYGTTGNGFYEVNAIDGAYGVNSPYAQVATWTTHPVSGTVLRTRMGNLYGVTGVNEYGLYAGDGGIAAANQYIRISNSNIDIHNIDFELYSGATRVFKIDHAIPSLAMGASVPTGYLVDDGIWMGKDGAAYKFRAGTVAGGVLTKGIAWDGTNLSVIGSINITGGDGIANLGDAGNLATKDSVSLVTEVTDKSLGNLDATANTKLSGIAAGATVGATWGVNLGSIPATLGTPAGSGLFLASTHMGYYTGGAWKTYIDNSGNFKFGDPATGPGLSWSQGAGTMTVRGTVVITSGSAGGWTINTDYMVYDTGVDNESLGIDPGGPISFWTGSTYANRVTAPFRLYNHGALYIKLLYIDNTYLASTYLPMKNVAGYISSSRIRQSGSTLYFDDAATLADIDMSAVVHGALRVPNLTQAQENALIRANGKIIYNTTLHQFRGVVNGQWWSFTMH